MERPRRRHGPLRLAAFLALAAVAPVTAHAAAGRGGGEADEVNRMGFMHRGRGRDATRLRMQERLQVLAHQAPPLTTPIPKFGIANVTAPTAVPPNMMLEPWADAQPMDTAVGAFLTSSLQGAPTATPPPSQAALNLMAAGCPVLDNWPQVVQIDAPEPCQTQSAGKWAAPPSSASGGSGLDLVSWGQSCSLFAGGLAPMLSYSMPSGDAFGTSSTAVTLVGNKVEIYDCGGVLRYYLEEKVYHEAGQVDQDSCMNYGSCDGTVWIQYFLRNQFNQLVAHTGYLHIFESFYQILDPSGAVIAKASRIGEWKPTDRACGGHRQWELKYSSPMPPGPFADPTQQWPIAAMVTIAAVRDSSRRPSGLVAPSWCEITKTGLLLGFLFIAAALLAGGIVLFIRVGRGPLRDFFVDLEARVCPKRMRKQSKYEGS